MDWLDIKGGCPTLIGGLVRDILPNEEEPMRVTSIRVGISKGKRIKMYNYPLAPYDVAKVEESIALM